MYSSVIMVHGLCLVNMITNNPTIPLAAGPHCSCCPRAQWRVTGQAWLWLAWAVGPPCRGRHQHPATTRHHGLYTSYRGWYKYMVLNIIIIDLWMESNHFKQFLFLILSSKDRYACSVYGVCHCMDYLWAWAWHLIIHNTADCCSASPLLSSEMWKYYPGVQTH